MFSPTKFPCTAWYVTPSLNVRECTVERRHHRYPDLLDSSVGLKYSYQLFSTREEAIAEAGLRLTKRHERYVAAGVRLAKCKATVEKLQKGGAA
ncbi:hypothetical protein Acf1_00016 [Acidovorax phage ACF1]|nr:hypothetical protein Acf1_00016 [Acidovorax phage ACF1]